MVDVMKREKIDILSVAGTTRRKGQDTTELRNGFYLCWVENGVKKRNGVGVVVEDGLLEEVKRMKDRKNFF